MAGSAISNELWLLLPALNNFRKQKMKTIATIIIALSAMVATAAEKPRLDIYPISEEKAVVALLNNNSAKFEISVRSDDGRIVYYKQSVKNDSNYRKIFDFSNLESGNYEVSFKVDNYLVKRDIQIERNGLKVGVSELRYDPFFVQEGDVLKLSYLNFDQNNLSISLIREREVVYSKTLGRDFNTTRGFDLSKLEKGQYQVVLADGSTDFYYTIEK
jgi:hypothetical protein